MRVVTLSQETDGDGADGRDETEPILVAKASPALVRAVLGVIVEHLGGDAASATTAPDTRRRSGAPAVVPLPPRDIDS